MKRSASKIASMRLIASVAIGDMAGAPLQRFNCMATSASELLPVSWHRDKVFLESEGVDATMEVQPRVQA